MDENIHVPRLTSPLARMLFCLFATAFLTVCIAVVILAGYLIAVKADLDRIRHAFDTVQIGDSLDAVNAKMGPPYTIIEHSPSADAVANDIVHPSTVFEYRYRSSRGWMPDFWSIQLDAHHRVVHKRMT